MNGAPAIVDTHCHLDVDAFDADRRQVVARSRAVGVTDIIVPAIRWRTFESLLECCDGYGFLHPALGLHPVYLDEHEDRHLEKLDRLLAERRPVAVGEIGLDFQLKHLDRGRQTALCARQLELAARRDLPVILHVRKAHDEMLALLAGHPVPRGGTVHAFNGSVQHGKKYIELGFRLGFGGMLTFERSRKLHRLAAALPLEGLVLETDAPDMPPASRRHQRNSPEYLPEVLSALCRVRGEKSAAVAATTTASARRLFRLDAPARA